MVDHFASGYKADNRHVPDILQAILEPFSNERNATKDQHFLQTESFVTISISPSQFGLARQAYLDDRVQEGK